MRTWIIPFALTAIFLCGCGSYPVYTARLNDPVDRPPYESEIETKIDLELAKEHTSSIGDVLFVIERYKKGWGKVQEASRGRQASIVPGSSWVGTHSYNGPDGRNLVVYTSPS